MKWVLYSADVFRTRRQSISRLTWMKRLPSNMYASSEQVMYITISLKMISRFPLVEVRE